MGVGADNAHGPASKKFFAAAARVGLFFKKARTFFLPLFL
jgi:hypothetical protein